MSRQLRCPNCGGEHTLVNPGITMLVCDFCKTAVFWDKDMVLKMGTQSILPEDDTRLHMHATGKLDGRPFEVMGHVRYDHGRGSWDEWYLMLADGSEAWLSEDERKLSLERPIRPDGPLPGPAQLRVGQSIALAGAAFTIREVGTATCVGGQGQLPFTILPGERYPYADLASLDGTRFATLEYDQAGSPTCFVGQVLGHGQITVDDERPPSTAGAKEGRHIKCPNCDAPQEVPADREVETLVCPFCGAQNDLTGAEARVMGLNPQGYDPGFSFEIGQAGTFEGTVHEVCGRMLYEDEEGYQTREYLLYNKDAGYLWLAEENHHFVLNKPTQKAPRQDPFRLAPKQGVDIGGTLFRFYEQGLSRLVYVDGALPWLARTGEATQYADLIAPPRMFCVETDGKEVEYFEGQYLTPEEVWAAFKAETPRPRAYGIHAAQPFAQGPLARAFMVLGGLFALLNLGLLLWSAGSEGKVLYSKGFSADDYMGEAATEPFAIGPERIMCMTISAPLQNSWLYVQAALVNAQDQVVEELDGELGYYYGVEEGESWSEGSQSTTTFGLSPPAGTYRLLLKAQGGTGETGPPGRENIQIVIKQGMVLSRYFLAIFVFCVLCAAFEIGRRYLFEKRRWSAVIEDDDDDD